ncbi:MAG: metallophosphoesterase [Ignavibacteriaceae bacterium]|nr:metallophosphoesterase [Ignavibacteriaceae bacterium]
MIPFFSFPQDEKNESFKVAFLTDIHVQKELNAERGFLSAINKVNEINPDFVITGGDLIMDALNQSYERSDSLFNLYSSLCDSFNMPVYNTIGNHDVFGLYKTSGVDTTHPEYGKKLYINRLGDGKSYSSFDHKGWHFILLDAIEFTPERKYIGGISQSQIDWIKTDLARLDKKTPIVLSTHIPFISVSKQILEGSTAALTEVIVVKNSKEILALFEGYNLKLVLQGHLHIVEEIIFKETHFITGGAVSGNWWKGSHYGFEEGFVIIEFYESDFNWEYIDYGWEVKETK